MPPKARRPSAPEDMANGPKPKTTASLRSERGEFQSVGALALAECYKSRDYVVECWIK
jgi:hypothetical protein